MEDSGPQQKSSALNHKKSVALDHNKSVALDHMELEDFVPRGEIQSPAGLTQKRYILTALLFLATFCLMCLRVDLSVAIVAMVNQTAVGPTAGERNLTDACFVDDDATASRRRTLEGEFEWDKKTQGMILSSFFYGYVLLQVLGGWLASRFSAKWTIALALLAVAILALFIPVAARTSYIFLMVLRAFQGLLQGLLFPAMSALMAKWFPAQEIVWLSSIRSMGASVGLVFGQFVAGFLCEGPGWPTVFYAYGSLTVLWFLLWIYFVYERPSDHPTISVAERKYLEACLGTKTNAEQVPTPWLAILRSPGMYAAASIFFAYDWFQFTVLTSLPQYMNDVLHFALSENGLLSAMPFLAFTILLLVTSKFVDYLSKGRATIIRKSMLTLGFVVTSVFLISLRYIGCDRASAVGFIIVAYAFQSFVQMVVSVAPLDLSRRHAGVVHGIGNTSSALSGTMAPYVVGLLTQHGATRGHWMSVFYISCSIGAVANVIFLLFGSSELQKWDSIDVVNTEVMTS